MSGRRAFASELDLRNVSDEFRDRFWSKVAIGEPDACWEWIAHRKARGYGQFTLKKGTFVTASRVALALSVGVIPAGHSACHACDNPPCCNPAHLFTGTQSDNALDSVSKGRANRARGEACPSSRLTEADVRAIRAAIPSYGFKQRLMKEYGVSTNTIHAIRARNKWRHVA